MPQTKVARLGLSVGIIVVLCHKSANACTVLPARGGRTDTGNVRVNWQNPPYSNLVSDGDAMWNGACNTENIPLFTTGTAGTTLNVTYNSGIDTTNGNYVCGFQPPGTNTILLWRYALDSGGHAIPCFNNEAGLAQNLAHEIGHWLGLQDQNDPACNSHIMGPDNPNVTRSVHSDECAEADTLNTTPSETGSGFGGNCDPNSDPTCCANYYPGYPCGSGAGGGGGDGGGDGDPGSNPCYPNKCVGSPVKGGSDIATSPPGSAG